MVTISRMQRSVTLLLVIAGSLFVKAESFQPGCTLPFEAIKGKDFKIDSQSGIEGAAGKVAENRARNKLCAAEFATPLNFVSFKKLQQKADEGKANGGNSKANRRCLGNIYTTSDGEDVGEGSLVTPFLSTPEKSA